MSDKQSSVVAKRKSEEGVVGGEGDQTKKPKLSFGLKKTVPATGKTASANPTKKITPISLKLEQQKPKEPPKIIRKSAAAAKAFADESDEEEEDMPPEAKMRMKNIGKNTPTSAGPNSFNKGKMGFCSPSAKWRTMRLTNNAEKKSVPEDDGNS